MVKTFSYISIVLVFLTGFSFAQEEEQIREKQSELSDIKQEISALEKELENKTKKEKESFAAIENYNKQNHLINKLVIKLKDEEELKENQITSTQKNISGLQDEIAALKENYAKYIKAIYKYGSVNELEGIFNAASVGQAVRRYKYLQKFSENRQKDLSSFEEKTDELLRQKNLLETEKKEKQQLVAQKQREEKELKNKLSSRQKILSAIRNDKKELKKEIDAKKEATIKIKNLIARLAEEAERKRREEAERLARLEAERNRLKNSTDAESNVAVKKEEISHETFNLDLSNLPSFSTLKGRLNWPIQSGKIVNKFGQNKNKKLNTVTLNYGVDIKASNDLNVKAVAEGVVSIIDWIPGYGSVVILTHKDEFRTVYSHLSEIYVKEGERVRPGNVIAKVGESIEGFVLHFEIWNERKNQNPETWLAKK